MAWLDFIRRRPASAQPAGRQSLAPNPHLNPRVRSAGFFSTDVSRLLAGWETTSSSIDHYLQSELRSLRARSRRMVRANPYGKGFVRLMKVNVVGPKGVTIQAQSMIARGGQQVLDTPANDAIEAAWKDWCRAHCHYRGKLSFLDLQNLAIACASQDGEFIFRKEYAGKYGFQLRPVDPELLDASKNEEVKGGGEIRLGVEYDAEGGIVAYWFRERQHNQYDSGRHIRVLARHIIHGFITEWPDQSRGVPWMHAGLERSKHLEKYDESAIVKARSSASTFAVLESPADEDPYQGEDGEMDDGVSLTEFAAGSIVDIGARKLNHVDSDYPHQMYGAFIKANLRAIATGLGVSYHSLSNDLEGVNYSSIRAGVLEDREIYKGLQGWFIHQFVQPVYEEWLSYCWLQGLIKVGTRPLSRPLEDYMRAHYQGRRWAWVDPQKDGAANQLAIEQRLKSRSQIMREQGDDPESVWREIQQEETLMKNLGIAPVKTAAPAPAPAPEEDPNAEEE